MSPHASHILSAKRQLEAIRAASVQRGLAPRKPQLSKASTSPALSAFEAACGDEAAVSDLQRWLDSLGRFGAQSRVS